MKIILLGKNGMLGKEFITALFDLADVELFGFDVDTLDITDHEAPDRTFAEISPDFVINCAAYTDVDGCESNREVAFSVNGGAVGKIAVLCKREGAVMVHFSTDYVFDGKKEEGYSENDLPSPISVYGESKLKGEKLIQQAFDNYYLIRISLLFGQHGKNFVNTMRELAMKHDELRVVTDQISSPTYAKDLAEAVVERFLKPHLEGSGDKLPFGVYHQTNSGHCSRFELVQKIVEFCGRDVVLHKVGSDAFPLPARRPQNSILLNTRCEGFRPWEEAVEAYLSIDSGIQGLTGNPG